MTKAAKRLFICLDNAGYEVSLERLKIYVALADAKAKLEGDFVDPFQALSIPHRSPGRPAAGNDDGFAECSPIFLLADRIHRPQLRQQLVDQRTQPRPRRAVRE